MEKLRIRGGNVLEGKLSIEGAKNAILPLMTASLLTDQPLTLSNVPPLTDIYSMLRLLHALGCKATYAETAKTVILHADTLKSWEAPYDIVRKMRASILVLGPLLGRFGKAVVSLPGGCAIGTRPIDFHIQAMEALGATLFLEDGLLKAQAPQGLTGASFTFPKVSVTGTANLIMAALFAKGTTTIHNAAKEPEIVDLCRCLEKMGAVIEGVGSSTLIIEGRQSLHGAQHHALPDRIETGSYIMAAAITGGDLFLEGATLDHLPTFDTLCREMGIGLFAENGGVRVKSPPPKDLKSLHITTEPFPGFPTDLQAQFMTLQTLTPGETEIHETIFENRMMHVAELRRMGANITLEGRKARVKGVNRLKGAPVMATDLRASKSLILAGLAADGETLINRMYHLDRGYHDLEGKLAACGAEIERFPGDEAPLIQRNLKKQASQSP